MCIIRFHWHSPRTRLADTNLNENAWVANASRFSEWISMSERGTSTVWSAMLYLSPPRCHITSSLLLLHMCVCVRVRIRLRSHRLVLNSHDTHQQSTTANLDLCRQSKYIALNLCRWRQLEEITFVITLKKWQLPPCHLST